MCPSHWGGDGVEPSLSIGRLTHRLLFLIGQQHKLVQGVDAAPELKVRWISRKFPTSSEGPLPSFLGVQSAWS